MWRGEWERVAVALLAGRCLCDQELAFGLEPSVCLGS
jgi:hypothetical protein